MVRRDTPVFAIVGVIGVVFSAWLANRTGEARNFFVPGFFLNGGYALLMIGTVVARRPAIGYIVAGFGGSDRWWEDPVRQRVFRTVTLLWAGIFLVRLAVQVPLYLANETVALGTARLVMGYPIFGLGLLLSWRLIQPVTRREAASTEPGNHCAGVDGLKGRARDALELTQIVVVPAGIRRTGHEPAAAVIGHHEPVLLHRRGDHLGLPGHAGEVVVGAQAQAQAHRRQIRIGVA